VLNVYVHLDVRGLPGDMILDDDFVEAIWHELPDAALGGSSDDFGVTLSQYALSADRAVRRQADRVKRALDAIGWQDAVVDLDEVVREGLRDDVSCLVRAVRWRLSASRFVSRLSRIA
jgi:hypothetical protein